MLDAPSLIGSAEAAERAGDIYGAIRLARQAADASGAHGLAWMKLVALARRLNDDDTAARAARRLMAETPSAEHAFVLAFALEATGRADEGVATVAPWLSRHTMSASNAHRLARMLMFANRFAEAERLARALLSKAPHNAFYWELLSQAKRFAPDDPDIGLMEEVWRGHEVAPANARAAIAFALAKAYVDCGDDAAAHRALTAANEAQYLAARFDLDSIESSERAALEAFVSDPPAVVRPTGAVFIVGPPRSGTTLIEQILARHPDIEGGGELNFAWLATRDIGEVSQRSVDAFCSTQEAPWNVLGKRYREFSAARFGTRRFVDKLLTNHLRLGLLRRALPESRVIWCRRSPLDVAWSCWRANFSIEGIWSTAPDAIARFIAAYNRLMRAWADRYPDFVLEVQYEDLVRSPDVQIPRMLAFAGLSDHAATRRPEDSKRAITTSSFAQVRGPINASRIGAQSAFPIATAPLRAALEKVGL